MFVNSQHKKADALLDEQKYDKAIIAFNLALEKNPDHPDILSHRGVCFLHLNQKKSCLDDLNKAKDLEPENSYRFASLAYAMDFFGDLDGAISMYEIAVKLDPEDAIAHNNLGLLLEKKGYMSKAKEKLDRADRLAGIEKKFYQTIEEEEKQQQNKSIVKPKGGTPLQPKKQEITPSPSKSSIVKSIITDKSTFREFLSFIKNGFKIKK
jgi:tetratricopeptide (TPR) repeat protein